jgi:hypothetical protein
LLHYLIQLAADKRRNFNDPLTLEVHCYFLYIRFGTVFAALRVSVIAYAGHLALITAQVLFLA